MKASGHFGTDNLDNWKLPATIKATMAPLHLGPYKIGFHLIGCRFEWLQSEKKPPPFHTKHGPKNPMLSVKNKIKREAKKILNK